MTIDSADPSDNRKVTRKDLATGSVSLQGRDFSARRSKAREMRCQVTFTKANAPTPVAHNLGFVPSGYTPLGASRGVASGGGFVYAAPGTVYNDLPLPADKRVIVLKCTVANSTVDILVR